MLRKRFPELLEKAIRSYLDILKKCFGDKLSGVLIFGSVAKGKATKDSDIDFLVLLDDSYEHDPIEEMAKRFKDYIQKIDHEEFMRRNLPYTPMSLYYKEKELRENPVILLDIQEQGIIIFDKEGKLEKIINDFKRWMKSHGTRKEYINEHGYYWILKPDLKPGEELEIRI